MNKNEFTISGTGKQVRDVLYADDLVNLYFSAIGIIVSERFFLSPFYFKTYFKCS